MNKTNVTLTLAVVGSILGVYLFFFGNSTVTNTVRETVGANSGPDSSSPYISNNGVITWFNTMDFNQATDTPCIITSPTATSTLVRASASIYTATNTDLTIDIGKAANGDREDHATTTLLGATHDWDNTTDDLLPVVFASTTLNTAVFAPNTNLVVKLAAKNMDGVTASDSFSITGVCNAVWTEAGN